MSQPHVIRLHGPWKCCPRPHTPAPVSARNPPDSFTVDCRHATGLSEILGDSFQGQLLLARSFHCPTGLTNDTHVRLVVRTDTAPLSVSLNDILLETMRHVEVNIDDHLRPVNHLQLTFALTTEKTYHSLPDLLEAKLEIT